jgi:hypothetical protein
MARTLNIFLSLIEFLDQILYSIKWLIASLLEKVLISISYLLTHPQAATVAYKTNNFYEKALRNIYKEDKNLNNNFLQEAIRSFFYYSLCGINGILFPFLTFLVVKFNKNLCEKYYKDDNYFYNYLHKFENNTAYSLDLTENSRGKTLSYLKDSGSFFNSNIRIILDKNKIGSAIDSYTKYTTVYKALNKFKAPEEIQ